MNTSDVITLATRIQRRRDFTAHLVGFLAGATVLTALHVIGIGPATQFAGTLLAWATALSTQHFRHVLRGPVTASDVTTEHTRRASTHQKLDSHHQAIGGPRTARRSLRMSPPADGAAPACARLRATGGARADIRARC